MERSSLIPYGRHEISKSDIKAVLGVLSSEFLTQGPVVKEFEDAVAKYCNVKFGVAMNSATSALHTACLALNLGRNDWFWTTANSFVASANCALHCGASVDFVDIDPDTYNMCPNKLSEKLLDAEKKGKLPKIVMPVHFAGQPCDMRLIKKLSRKYGFQIIEDASHAIGAMYAGHKIGSCKYSDITVFSFHPVKLLTTGEGGMAMTNDEGYADKMRRLSSHGITNDPKKMKSRPKNEIWNYQQFELGFNYRMTDIHAALGKSQLKRLDVFVRSRHKIAERYNHALKKLPLRLPTKRFKTYSSYHLYQIRVSTEICGKDQQYFYDALWKNGIEANLHYIPIHRHPYFEALGFEDGDFPEAEKFHREVITLPIYPKLTRRSQDRVIRTLKKAVLS